MLMSLLFGCWLPVAMSADMAHFEDDGRAWEDEDFDYDRARRAVNRGEILPMAHLLERVRKQVPGEIVDVELEREDGRWAYEFKVIDGRGRLLEVTVDARTGRVFAIEDD